MPLTKKVRRLEGEVEDLSQKLTISEVRLTIAQAWGELLDYAYDQLLYHGVNYKTLPEFKDSTVLEDAQDLPITTARSKIVTWVGTLSSAITAAVRRKGMKLV